MSEKIQEQVKEFFESGAGEKPEESGTPDGWETEDDIFGDDAPIFVAPVEEPPAVAPAKEPIVGEPIAPVVEKPAVVAPPVSAPVVENPELVALKEQNAKLVEQLNKLMAGTVTPPPVAAPVVPAPSVPPPQMSLDFVGDEDIDEILSSKDKVNALLGKVMQVAAQHMVAQLPTTVQGVVAQQHTVNEFVNTFYTENGDLKQVKSVVGAVANTVGREHQDWTLAQVLEETAKRTREMLGLPGKSAVATPPPTLQSAPIRPAALPGGNRGGGRTPVGTHSEMQKQINDLL